MFKKIAKGKILTTLLFSKKQSGGLIYEVKNIIE
jgi:hypothetical protein